MRRTAWLRSLAFRLILFLSIALIPVGLLAVLQTNDIVEQARERDRQALAGLTLDAARAEREIIQMAFGMAQGLAPIATILHNDPARCSATLAAFIESQGTAVTAGFIRPDGTMWCSSRGGSFDFSAFPGWADSVANPTPMVEVNPSAPVSNRPVVIVNQPLFADGALIGFAFLSVPHELLASAPGLPAENDLTVVTFTASGRILSTAGAQADTPERVLPADMTLSDLTEHAHATLRTKAANGARRSYAVSPIADGTIYVVGTWVPVAVVSSAPIAIPPQFFPIIMWLTSLGVAFATVYRLVIRHIARLRRQMRAFAIDRRLPSEIPSRDLSAEIDELQQSFAAMADRVMRDEAELEQLVHDKNVLLKEVHHRVKNNLQLISSIMNMQLRRVRTAEARAVVQRLQERVLGLATIHRNLYRTENLSQVRTAAMLTELTDQILSVGLADRAAIKVDRSFDDVTLYPDQAVPLSLLVAEAVTNALKYCDGPDKTWLRISLSAGADGQVRLTVANSVTAAEIDAERPEVDGTGLGSNLMKAFALQLDGTLATEETGDSYTVRVDFLRQAFVADKEALTAA